MAKLPDPIQININAKPMAESFARIAAVAAAFSAPDVAQVMRNAVQAAGRMEEEMQKLNALEPEQPEEKKDLRSMIRSIRFKKK